MARFLRQISLVRASCPPHFFLFPTLVEADGNVLQVFSPKPKYWINYNNFDQMIALDEKSGSPSYYNSYLATLMSVPNFMAINPTVIETFYPKTQMLTCWWH